MKLIDIERYLTKHGCTIARQGGRHTIYSNKTNGATAPVPRHREIQNLLVKKICDELGIPRP